MRRLRAVGFSRHAPHPPAGGSPPPVRPPPPSVGGGRMDADRSSSLPRRAHSLPLSGRRRVGGGRARQASWMRGSGSARRHHGRAHPSGRPSRSVEISRRPPGKPSRPQPFHRSKFTRAAPLSRIGKERRVLCPSGQSPRGVGPLGCRTTGLMGARPSPSMAPNIHPGGAADRWLRFRRCPGGAPAPAHVSGGALRWGG